MNKVFAATIDVERRWIMIPGAVIMGGVTVIVGYMTIAASSAGVFAAINENLMAVPALYALFLAATVVNNLYQVPVHFLTGIKFLRRPVRFIPGGARDNQSAAQFIFYDLIDALGWLMFFVVLSYANIFLVILFAVHVASGVLAGVKFNYFQRTYIVNPAVWPDWWNKMRAMFVFTDGIARGALLIFLAFYLAA